jgi:gas vesicle protein
MARNHHESNNKHLLFGILAGTVVGAVAAAVVNSQRGRAFREDLYDAYHNASQRVNDAAHSLSEKTYDLSNRFTHKKHQPADHTNLTIGAIAGGILGISAILFLSSESSKGIRERLAETIETLSDKAHTFEDMAHDAAENFEDRISPWVHRVESFVNSFNGNECKSKKNGINPQFDKILDWAVTAAQVYQSLKK